MFGSPRSVLHPEDAPEVLVDFPRPMTLGAAHKQLSHICLLYSAKHELITLAAAAGAGFAMHISANRADFPLSLEHGLFLPGNRAKDFAPIFGKDCTFENTKEVGGTRPKRGLLLRNRLPERVGGT